MHYLIYKITNRLNNKIYVGKHKTENKDDDYFGSGVILGRSVEKYGKENFTKEILFECSSEEEMNRKEADIVDEEFIARDDTYNVMLGGCGGFSYINDNGLSKNRNQDTANATSSHSRYLREDSEYRDEYLKKLSLGQKKRFCGGGPFVGKTHSDETKKKMRESKLGMYDGIKNPAYGKHWITDGKTSMIVKKDLPIPNGWKKGRK